MFPLNINNKCTLTSNLTSLSNYKAFISKFNEDQVDTYGDDYTSCWLYAYYVHSIIPLPLTDSKEPLYEHTSVPDFKHDGLYSMYIATGDEFHHFIIIVKGQKIQLLSTYGGQQGIINLTFDKIEWIQGFKSLTEKADLGLMMKLFGINRYPHKNKDCRIRETMYTFKAL